MGSSMYPGGKGASVMLGCRSREQLAGRGEEQPHLIIKVGGQILHHFSIVCRPADFS